MTPPAELAELEKQSRRPSWLDAAEAAVMQPTEQELAASTPALSATLTLLCDIAMGLAPEPTAGESCPPFVTAALKDIQRMKQARWRRPRIVRPLVLLRLRTRGRTRRGPRRIRRTPARAPARPRPAEPRLAGRAA